MWKGEISADEEGTLETVGHWKRAVQEDETRRQRQLTRLMSSPFLRHPPLSDPPPITLSLSGELPARPPFLLRPPSFQPSSDHFTSFVHRPSSVRSFRGPQFLHCPVLRCSFYFFPIAFPLLRFKFNCYARIANLSNADEFVMPRVFVRINEEF